MMLLKKTIPISVMIFLVLSIAVNAAWIESFYGQSAISGAPTVNNQYLSFSFEDIVDPSETKTINHDVETELNGIKVKSTYNPSTKNAKLELSKDLQIKYLQRVKFGDGIWTASVGTDKLIFIRGDSDKKDEEQPVTGTIVFQNNFNLELVNNMNKIEFPYNAIVPLPNDFFAIAKIVNNIVTIIFFKAVIVNNNEKIPGTNILVSVNSESIKLSTVAIQNIPAAKKVSFKDRIFGYFKRVFRRS